MSYKSLSIDGLYVLRWQQPDVPDVAAYANEIAAARARQGKLLVGMFIMPPESTAPTEPFRKEQARRLPEIMGNLVFAVTVFEGTGFMAAMRRSALVAILMLSPKRFPVYVRATVRDALVDNPPQPVPFDAKRAMTELERLGMLNDGQ
jgi:hypothetical protein